MAGADVTTYAVAGAHPWNREEFDRRVVDLPGDWHFLGARDELTVEVLTELDPRYVFFLHWSWIVPASITDRWECVCFHMTDVPYGRGGSPLQNLILRGHDETKLTALRMTQDLDAGPVYGKVPLSLAGRAEDVYRRATVASMDLAEQLAATEPDPVAQEGEVVAFERRRPEQSELPPAGEAREIYDFIRMLDAEGYPRAFVRRGDLRLELSDARLDGDVVRATVTIATHGGTTS
jgi:methionyl-tRNA formyltransferase